MEALSLRLLIDLIGKRRGARPLLRREREGPDVVELGLLEHVEKLLELIFGLAGEADHDRGAQRDAGDALAYPAHKREVVLERSGAVHVAQNARGGMLEGHVEVVADVGMRGDRVEQLVGDADRLDVHQAEPDERMLLGEDGDEVRGGVARLELLAPPAGVLGDQRDLADAGGLEIVDLGPDVIQREAAVAPADVRDRAERAEAVASVADLDVCGGADAIGGGGVLPVGNVRRADDGTQHLDDVFLLAAGDERGGLGELAFELRSVARGQAARHDDLARAVIEAGIPAQLEDGTEALLGRGLDERAGVDDDGVGGFGILAQLVSGGCHPLHHLGGVHLVFRAAERDERDTKGTGPFTGCRFPDRRDIDVGHGGAVPLAVVDVLEGLSVILALQKRDDFLQRVARR